MFRQDVILRAIEQIAAAIAKALGFVGAAQFEDALVAVRDGKSALPIVPGMVDEMAPEALFQLLGKEHSPALVALLDAEADALAGLKRDVLAERSRHRARALDALARAVAGGSAPSGSPSPR
ncbi:MAG: hypothetical protein ABI895_24105 [Deltaproteobacteria bacterium]